MIRAYEGVYEALIIKRLRFSWTRQTSAQTSVGLFARVIDEESDEKMDSNLSPRKFPLNLTWQISLLLQSLVLLLFSGNEIHIR